MSQRTVEADPSPIVEAYEQSQEEEEETKNFLFQYLSRRAERDKDISSSSAEIIQHHTREVVQTRPPKGDGAAAVNVASKLADLGR